MTELKSARPATWIVVAAFNEAAVIGAVVSELVCGGWQVVVVDDGSVDRTAAVAQGAGARVVRHPVNLGQGAALQTGIDFALKAGAAQIVTFDADGQHHAGDIPALLAPLLAGEADFALGSRMTGTAPGIRPSRKVLLRLATLFTRWTTGLAVTDSHNGLRAMTRRGAGRICLTQSRMAHASELLDQIARSGLAVREVPVTVSYSAYSRAKGQSGLGAVAVLLDLAAERIRR